MPISLKHWVPITLSQFNLPDSDVAAVDGRLGLAVAGDGWPAPPGIPNGARFTVYERGGRRYARDYRPAVLRDGAFTGWYALWRDADGSPIRFGESPSEG